MIVHKVHSQILKFNELLIYSMVIIQKSIVTYEKDSIGNDKIHIKKVQKVCLIFD